MAARPAKSHWSPSSSARATRGESRRTVRTKSQIQRQKPMYPTSSSVVQPLVVEDRGVSLRGVEAGEARTEPFAEEGMTGSLR